MGGKFLWDLNNAGESSLVFEFIPLNASEHILYSQANI